MKLLMSFVAMALIAAPSFAAVNAGGARRSVSAQWGAAPRTVASKNQLSAPVSVSGATDNNVPLDKENGGKPSLREDGEMGTPSTSNPPAQEEPEKDMREKERAACLANNIGIGNTFVWASKYSNLSNYGSMVEDVENPENNVCFVRVELRSDDPRVDVSDIPGKYFEFGQTITCGSWVDAEKLKKRILDAKKSARTWGTVAGVVGGAGVGVGMMELFGNRLIGGAVEGQKGLERDGKTSELLKSQLGAMKNDDPVTYNKFISMLKELKTVCDGTKWEGAKPEGCSAYDYDLILGIAGK